MLEHLALALVVVLVVGLELLQVVVVDVEHGVMVDDVGIAAQVGVEHECLAVVARQAVVDRVVAAYLSGEAVEVIVDERAAEQVVVSGSLGLA